MKKSDLQLKAHLAHLAWDNDKQNEKLKLEYAQALLAWGDTAKVKTAIDYAIRLKIGDLK